MIWCILLVCTLGLGVVSGDPIVLNTTVAATNIESTIGTPALLVDPTLISSQNTTDGQYEVSLLTYFFFFIKLHSHKNKWKRKEIDEIYLMGRLF